MDMLFDGRRVYSFWLHRDGSRVGAAAALQSRWRVPWPRTLQEFLDGTARFTWSCTRPGSRSSTTR